MIQLSLFPSPQTAKQTFWHEIRDGHPSAYAVACQHYAFQNYADGRRHDCGYRNRHLFVGPGQKIVLLTANLDALFVWRRFIPRDGQTDINCSIFINRSRFLSNDLIRAAMHLAWARWPGQRFYTYVDPTAVCSPNPGYYFKRAGWSNAGVTKVNKLLILAYKPPAQGEKI